MPEGQVTIRDKSSDLHVSRIQISDQLDQFAVLLDSFKELNNRRQREHVKQGMGLHIRRLLGYAHGWKVFSMSRYISKLRDNMYFTR